MKRYLNKSVVILLSGHAGVGKSTSAKYLEQKLSEEFNCVIAPFAKGVKNVAYSMGWDGLKDLKGRTLLQGIGGIGRDYNENIWVEKTFESLAKSPHYPFDFVFVDDWRFPNEEFFAREQFLYAVYTIRIVAPEREILKGTPQYFDVSETSLDGHSCDYVVYNNYEFESLYSDLDGIIEDIITKNLYYVQE